MRGDGSSGRRAKPQPDVAAKILRTEFSTDTNVMHRFLQERTMLMDLKHRNIVQVLDMVMEGDRLAIIMDLMAGGTLAQSLSSKGTLPPSVALPAICAVLDALSYAHGKGVLHRDVKPANVLLTDRGLDAPDSVKLGDFGIASFTDERGVHATGLVGSPAYMPPELFMTGTVSAASDVYAAGITLYELLAGRTPFAGPGTAHTISFRQVQAAPPPLPVDARLWRVIAAMLAKDPAERLTAAGAATALRQLPEDVVNQPALPVQPDPAWGDLTQASLPHAKPVKALDAGLDLGQTLIPGSGETPPNYVAPSGRAKAVLGSEPVVNPAETQLGFVDRPQPVTAQVSVKKKPWRLIIAISVAAVLVVGGGTTAVLKSGILNLKPSGSTPSPISWVPAHLTGQPSATGLRIDFDAAGTPSVPGSVNLTVTLSAPRSTGLSGDILVVVPPADNSSGQPSDSSSGNSSCPEVIGDGVQPAIESTDGVSAACAQKVTVSLAALEVKKLVWQVTGNIGTDLGSWLNNIQSQTSQALYQVTGPDFPLQRISGINVSADSLIRTEASPQVQYRVFAQWSGGQQMLFSNNTLSFQATDLLLSLTGGAGVSGVRVDSCSATTVNGIVVLALQPTPSCSIQVTIGELVSRQTSFTIQTSGS